MDFTKLRATALQSVNDEEAVTVNTRALIDKVLARYSGEWTTLRELIQNAADAQASTVKIKFETYPSATTPLPNTTNSSEILKHVLLNHTLQRLVVTNDGLPFGDNDWSRLKRIAEGNPDETKIGAFGVGFYSVFADCEEPFVSSADQAMAFYWKGNALFTRKTQLPPEQTSRETNFVLDYRNKTTPMPNLLSICQFLATSLTFVALRNLELWLDDSKIVAIQKKVSPGIPITISKDINTMTKEGIMKIQNLERESVQMDATFMNVVGWKPAPTLQHKMPGSFEGAYGGGGSEGSFVKSFFSRISSSTGHDHLKTKAMKEEKLLQDIVLEDVTATTTVSVFLRVTTATVKTQVSAQFAAELERATKKPPPKVTRPAILTASYDESVASTEGSAVAKNVDIFGSVMPGQNKGRIFIGFPTHQTTGAGLHLSAPSVIPTVERESIDLNARWVRTWNIEMLRAAGIMARLSYINEMNELSDDIKQAVARAGRGTKVSKEEIDRFTPRALHILKTFAFKSSTPNATVAELIVGAFWIANEKAEFEVFSSRGVLSSKMVRMATEDFSGFVEGIPIIPNALVKDPLITSFVEYGVISGITISDVIKELSAKSLTAAQLSQFVKWISNKAAKGEIDRSTINSVLDAAVASTDTGTGSGRVVALGSITTYLDVKRVPSDLPIPATCLPFEFTRMSQVHDLQALGWEALDVVPWLRNIVQNNHNHAAEQNYKNTIAYAASILQVLSKNWDTLGDMSKSTITELLKNETIIPTKRGMRKPEEAYLANVKLFDDLPNIMSCPGVKEKFLTAIGLRKTVDLDTVFTRLLAPSTEDDLDDTASGIRFMNVIKYLASVQLDIPEAEIKKLSAAKFCPAEAGPKGMESSKGSLRKYSVKELYEPDDGLRQLGLPILRWPNAGYRAKSATGAFLISLGLRAYPSVPDLIDIMVVESTQPGPNLAMKYFITNHQNNEYWKFAVSTTTKKFLPLQNSSHSTAKFASPQECFTNQECQVLGFEILRLDLQPHANKFGVSVNPPISECINRLLKSPPTERRVAVEVFEYMSTRINEIGKPSVEKIRLTPIIPVITKSRDIGSGQLKMIAPYQCYLGTSSTYGDILDFVDFGGAANAFLFKCGAKAEPTIKELALLASTEPARLYGVMQSPDKYTNLLRKLAQDVDELKKDKKLWKYMQTAPFLIGEAEVPALMDKKGAAQDDIDLEDDDENAPIKQHRLAAASDIVVIDDFVSYRIFKSSLLTAIEDEKLESFYLSLGSSALSNTIETRVSLGPLSRNQEIAPKVQAHVLERAKLFLHELRRQEVKHDYSWLEKYLLTQVVDSIELGRKLTGLNIRHREKRTAACDKANGYHVLYITAGNVSWYQVSASICKLLLDRPGQSHMITFEQFLSLSLTDLKNRGYNVGRVLRLKAAERRMAEEERQKQLVAEQERIKEQEQSWQSEKHPELDYDEKAMPGAFEDSPESSPTPVPQTKSRFTLGGLNLGQFGQQVQRALAGRSSNSQEESRPQGHKEKSGDNSKALTTTGQQPKPGGSERVTSPAALQSNLLAAINSSRPYSSDHVFSEPTTNVIKEQATYCDSTPENNLICRFVTNNGTRIFIDKDQPDPETFIADYQQSIRDFDELLLEICNIYRLDPAVMHIFYNAAGATIAFNTNGSIFCNLRYFVQLHRDLLKMERAAVGQYWFVVVAHELSHNLVKQHDANHSYYTESLIAEFFSRMVTKSTEWAQIRDTTAGSQKRITE